MKLVPTPSRGRAVRSSVVLLVAWLAAVLASMLFSGDAAEAAAASGTRGYLIVDSAGVVTAFGDASSQGSLLGTPLNATIVDGDMTPTGAGYVLVAADGGVFAFGDAPYLGGMAGRPLAAPIVGIDVTPTGAGYVLVAADGGVFTFGDAPFRGSLGGMRLNAPIVDVALTLANDGYWLAAADGGVFAFGNARFTGSMASTRLNAPIIEVVISKDGFGYGLIASDGGVFAFGGFPFRGSLGGMALNRPIVDAVPSATGDGYHLVGGDGGVFAFGDAPFAGSFGGQPTSRPIVLILAIANEAPKAEDDAYDAVEDTPLVVTAASGVVANDGDGDGDALSASLLTGPNKGTLSLAADGSFTYAPTGNSFGTDSFTYTASDGYGGTDTATVIVRVAAVNDIPVAADDSASTNEDTPLTVAAPGVLGNDADVETSPTAVLVTGPSNGTLALNADGSYLYTPNANAHGTDSFAYKANDGTVDSNVATVSLTITTVNDAPVAVDDAYSTSEDTSLTVIPTGVLANDSDVEGDSFGAAVVTGPTKGTLVLNGNGSFVYTPNADANGADSFTYKANDGTADSNVATVNITVNAVNDAPVVADDSSSTNEDTALNVVAPGVLGNDSDVDGNPLTAVLVTGPTKGTLTLNGNGSYLYTPNANANGADSFTYKANDGTADSNVATVNLTINAVNDAPVAADDAYSTNEDTALNVVAPGVLGNDSDLEGSPLTAVVAANPTKGTLSLNGNGSFTYTPNANANGADSFTYKANDGTADSNVATVNLTVNAVNDSPVAVNDAPATNEDSALNVAAPGVLANDTDIDANPVTAVLVSNPGKGTLTLNADGSYLYTPNANTNGADSFTYKANDGTADSNVATVNITVNAVNDAPVAVDDAYGTDEDVPLALAAPGVLTNDSDIEGTALSAVLVTGPTKGTLTLDGNGSFTYTPNANTNGADSFTYKANDGTADSNTVTVSLTVTAVNDAPTAGNNTFLTNEDTPFTVTAPGVLANDTDTEGNPLTAIKLSDPTLGVLAFNADGSFTYTPNANANGVDSFTYKANDGAADSNVATVFITVDAVNDLPVAVDDAYQAVEDTALTVAAPGVRANDTDADGTTLAAGNAADPANGTVTLNADGSFTYTPDNGFNGIDTFTYDVTDGIATDTGLVTITVVPPNAVPTADATIGSGNEDGGAITVTLIGHDDDGDALTFTAGTATNGLVTVPSGTSCDANVPSTCTANVAYTPGANFNGGDSFTYTVNDGTIDSDAAPANITVNPVNDEPSFTNGANQTVNEDSGAQTVNGWATAISAGPADESGQTVTFTVTTDNNPLFSVPPAVSSGGALTYTPAANANGSATVSVTAVDSGGTADGGDNTGVTQAFTITVTAVNDVPSFTKGSDQTLNEDAGAQSVSNWATAISKGPADESGQTLSFTTSNDNNSLFSVQPGVTPTGTLTYTTAPNLFGTATVNISLSDTGGTANGGVDTSGTQTFTITVNSVNDAPVAAAQSFDVQTNMKISLGGLLAGATDPNDVAGNAAWAPSYTVGSITPGAGCIGCTISNVDNANGTFDFEPPAGGTGTYTVTYTVVDNGTPTPGVASAAQTITFNVAGPVIWFADATAGNDTTGTGTLTRPFATLARVATVDETNHRVFVHPGTYAAGITLPSGEWLVGAGTKATSFDTFMGITPPLGTVARPAINGTNPTVQSPVTLGAGNTVRGLTLTGPNALTGTSFGTLTTGVGSSADVVLNSTGQALSLTTGTITGDFVSTTSSGGTDNVFLSSVNTTATTSLGTGALSGATSEGLQVVGGTGSFTYAGTVANATGTTVSIANKTGGTMTLSGAVSDTAGAGVSLSSNTGATIAFTGGVSLTSGGSTAFSATGGGTLTVTGAANTLTSTTGTALNVANTTIGGLTFQSISSNGGANGIVLNATGSSGSLVVTGTGTTLGSGGTIQNTTGDGVSLTSTTGVSLANLNVTNANGHGIRGSGVTNLTLTRAQVSGAGDADNEHGVHLTNQAGTLAVSGGTYSNAADNLLLVENTNTNLTATINSAVFQNTVAPLASTNNALQFVPNGTSAITANVTNSTFTNIYNSSVNFGAATALSSGASSLTFSTNVVNSAAGYAGGVLVSGQENTTTTTTITVNTFTGAGGDGVVNHDANDASTLFGTIAGNTFTSPKGHAIVGLVDEDADLRLRIDSNNITNAGGDGIQLANFGDAGAPAMTSTAHFLVTNNSVNGHSQSAVPGVPFIGGIGIFHFENDADTTCARVTGNTVSGSNPGAGYFDIFLQDNSASKFLFEENPNTGATGAVTPSYIQSLNNPGTNVANIENIDARYSNGTTCLAP